MRFEAIDKVRVVGGPKEDYVTDTATNLYVEFPLTTKVNTLFIVNDSDTDTLSYSFDGATLEGEIKLRESLDVNVQNKSSIYVKGAAGGDTFRIWGY